MPSIQIVLTLDNGAERRIDYTLKPDARDAHQLFDLCKGMAWHQSQYTDDNGHLLSAEEIRRAGTEARSTDPDRLAP